MHIEKQGNLVKFIKWAMSGGRDLAYTSDGRSATERQLGLIYRYRHARTDQNSKILVTFHMLGFFKWYTLCAKSLPPDVMHAVNFTRLSRFSM